MSPSASSRGPGMPWHDLVVHRDAEHRGIRRQTVRPVAEERRDRRRACGSPCARADPARAVVTPGFASSRSSSSTSATWRDGFAHRVDLAARLHADRFAEGHHDASAPWMRVGDFVDRAVARRPRRARRGCGSGRSAAGSVRGRRACGCGSWSRCRRCGPRSRRGAAGASRVRPRRPAARRSARAARRAWRAARRAPRPGLPCAGSRRG